MKKFFAIIALSMIAAGCASPHQPSEVTKASYKDDNGRTVTTYVACEPGNPLDITNAKPFEKRDGFDITNPLNVKTNCRTETMTENFCYKTLGRVDCFDRPAPTAKSRLRN